MLMLSLELSSEPLAWSLCCRSRRNRREHGQKPRNGLLSGHARQTSERVASPSREQTSSHRLSIFIPTTCPCVRTATGIETCCLSWVHYRRNECVFPSSSSQTNEGCDTLSPR